LGSKVSRVYTGAQHGEWPADDEKMSVKQQITAEVRLPRAVALWVLGAHAYALLVPLILLPVLTLHWDFVAVQADYPLMFNVAIGLMMAGSAFEIAQNTFDNWYLEADDASANGSSFCDMLFFWFIIASQTALIIACKGDWLWLSVPAFALTAIYPMFYMGQRFAFFPLALLGTISTAVIWWTFGDPVLLLQLGLPAVTMYFFGLLLKTGNQLFHGYTTIAASSGVVILTWGLHRSAIDAPDGWLMLGIIAGVVAAILLSIRPLLTKLEPTPSA